MSSARKRFAETRTKQQLLPGYSETPARSEDAVDADVMRTVSDPVNDLPPEIMRVLHAASKSVVGPIGLTSWDRFKRYNLSEQLSKHAKDENAFIAELVTQAAEQGFRLALGRYAAQLQRVPELAAWHRTRAQGGAKGRQSQSQAKLERAARARAMLAKGDDVPAIAAALNCTPSTVYRLLSPANGKPAKRSKRARKR